MEKISCISDLQLKNTTKCCKGHLNGLWGNKGLTDTIVLVMHESALKTDLKS